MDLSGVTGARVVVVVLFVVVVVLLVVVVLVVVVVLLVVAVPLVLVDEMTGDEDDVSEFISAFLSIAPVLPEPVSSLVFTPQTELGTSMAVV